MNREYNIASSAKFRSALNNEIQVRFICNLIFSVVRGTTSCSETASSEQKTLATTKLWEGVSQKDDELLREGLAQLNQIVLAQEQDSFGANLTSSFETDDKKTVFKFFWSGTIKPGRFLDIEIKKEYNSVFLTMSWDTATKKESGFLKLPSGAMENFPEANLEPQANYYWFAVWREAKNLSNKEVLAILKEFEITKLDSDLADCISRSSSARVSDAEHSAFLKKILKAGGNPFHPDVESFWRDNPYHRNGANSDDDMETGWKNYQEWRNSFYSEVE